MIQIAVVTSTEPGLYRYRNYIGARHAGASLKTGSFVLFSEQTKAKEVDFENCGGRLWRERRRVRSADTPKAACSTGSGDAFDRQPLGRENIIPGNGQKILRIKRISGLLLSF